MSSGRTTEINDQKDTSSWYLVEEKLTVLMCREEDVIQSGYT